jgi:hypothetical protein
MRAVRPARPAAREGLVAVRWFQSSVIAIQLCCDDHGRRSDRLMARKVSMSYKSRSLHRGRTELPHAAGSLQKKSGARCG